MASLIDKSESNLPKPSSSGSVRLKKPESSRAHKPKMTEFIDEINPARGFVEWLRQNAVVGLAIGFVVGTQVQVVVKQLISSFIDPLFLLLFGQQLSQRTFTVHFNSRSASFSWGTFVYVLINFVFLLLVIYIIIKLLNLDKLDKPKNKQ